MREGERGQMVRETVDFLHADDVRRVVKYSARGDASAQQQGTSMAKSALLHQRRDAILDLSSGESLSSAPISIAEELFPTLLDLT